MNIKQLRERAAALNSEERALRTEGAAALDTAASGGTLTDAQRARDDEITARLAAIKVEREATDAALVNAERLADLERNTHVAVTSNQREAADSDPMRGFKSPRDYLLAVQTATQSHRVDPRLRPLGAAGSDEQSGFSDPHGGYFLPEAMSPEILSVPAEIDPTAGRVRAIPMTAPKVTFKARVDKNHSSSVSGGLTVSRRDESGTAASSRIAHEKVTLTANSQFGIAYATEEILVDSPVSFAALIADGFTEEFASETLNERLNGTGAGEYLGVLNAPCTIEVAKEAAQTADTINGANIKKMRARAWRYANCIWLANHDTLTDLMSAHIALTNDDVKLFAPGNGVDVPDTLFGRPIYFTEYCKTIGDAGDIILADFSQYLEGTYQSLASAESMHVRFLQHERTFKFYRRNDGQPWWRSALTPKNSATTLSPFVTLAARA